ncbi:isocitrate lyase/phosphoenolpyruvate mutase family protein [Curvibacter sp. CHRR-16]|uniref:isocitrate lyase/PEP mutase family protein n=1 Tax=Curvibacter sp. CHRR-16 TaxID=2835872 RepID=UPI001BD94B45|nr:isocitrate lyase/phosphoenolpyruvate mutase family protein [Curvibacter sp. CHRR-16]MBT0570746.1 isocitrate lyase/phosphoenolpyruvate mutase family protein [Curvibacter sp. CHRR-16]
MQPQFAAFPSESLLSRGQTLRDLHRQGTWVMPNAWDAGSARLLEAEGFPALGTTSAGIAFSMGCPDGADAVNRNTMLDAIYRIARAVRIPVNADLESGYGQDAAGVADTIRLVIQAGASGANIEDATGITAAPLFALPDSVERIAAARQAADATGIPFTLTARCDAFLCKRPDALHESIERCRAYRAAGADCLFVPGLNDETSITALVKAVQHPVNVVMGLTDSTLTVQQLTQWGVRRISTGGSLARACLGLLRRAGQEIQQKGSFSYAQQQIPDAELSAFFAQSI